MFLLIIIIALFITCVNLKPVYKFENNKKLDNIQYFRDNSFSLIYTNLLLSLFDYSYSPSNFFGSLLLKWIDDGIIEMIDDSKLKLSNKFPKNVDEKKLYIYVFVASDNGILETGELEYWIKSNYNKIKSHINRINRKELNKLIKEKHIKKPGIFSNNYIMDDKIYNDAKKILGFKKYLSNFSILDERDIKEIVFWNKYIIYAHLFGIANKVNDYIDNFYPEGKLNKILCKLSKDFSNII